MNLRLGAVLADADLARRELLDAVSTIPPVDLVARPTADSWSVAEVLEHLLLVESGSVLLLMKLFRKARDQGLPSSAGLEANVADQVVLAIQPLESPAFVAPAGGRDPQALLGDLSASRQRLHALAEEVAPFDVASVVGRHAALGELNVYQWVHFLGEHERRHRRQVQQIADALAATASPFSNPAGQDPDGVSRYVTALVDLLGDRDPLAVLAEHADAIERATRGVSDEQARLPEREGKWAIIQVMQHLVDTEVVYGYRMRMSVAHDTPAIQGYDQDLWATRLHYREERLADSLADLRQMRARNLRFLRRLSSEELDRAGMHAERGAESVRRMITLIAAHDLLHRAQIMRIRTALGLGG